MVEIMEVSDDVLVGLLSNPAAVQRFPFLQGLNQRLKELKPGGCASCQRKAALTKHGDLVNARVAITGLDQGSLDELKAILSTKKIRMVYRQPNSGKVQQITL